MFERAPLAGPELIADEERREIPAVMHRDEPTCRSRCFLGAFAAIGSPHRTHGSSFFSAERFFTQ